MKSKSIFILATMLLWNFNLSAHYIWMETTNIGKIGRTDTVKIYYGEFNSGRREVRGGMLDNVKGIECWAIAPNGKRLDLKVTESHKFYQALLTPTMAGTYTIVAVNKVLGVADWSSHGMGIVKPAYHAGKQIVVGGGRAQSLTADHTSKMMVVPYGHNGHADHGKAAFQLLLKNKPLEKVNVHIHAQNGWSKEYQTDQYGKFHFDPLWKGTYVIQCYYKEENPGKFAGKKYEVVQHLVSFTHHQH